MSLFPPVKKQQLLFTFSREKIRRLGYVYPQSPIIFFS